jgi:AraC-like DNA-binding protein
VSPPAADPIEPAQRQRAERLLLAALRRLHRAHPLAPDHRVDAVLGVLRASGRERRPRGHRGAGALDLDDAALLTVIDDLVADGRLRRSGRRVALAEHAPRLAVQDRERIDRLLDALRAAGGSPPRVETLAKRLGITPALVAELRTSGRLASLGSGIDYPPDVLDELRRRIDEIAHDAPPTVARVAAELGVSRRYAEALVRDWSGAASDQAAPRRASPASAGGQSSPAASRASRKAAAAAPRSPRDS